MAQNIIKQSKQIYSEALTAAGDTFSDPQSLEEEDKGQYLEMNVSSWVAGSFVATFQHSPDGTNWYDLQATASLGANGQEIVKVTEDALFSRVRAKITATGASVNATVEVKLHF